MLWSSSIASIAAAGPGKFKSNKWMRSLQEKIMAAEGSLELLLLYEQTKLDKAGSALNLNNIASPDM